MEGYLNKYINVVYRWRPRYFVLKNGILTYYDSKEDAPKGTIHLKISEIDLTPEDPLKIIINSGTKTLQIRANTIGEKIKWLNALRASKEEIQIKDSEYCKMKNTYNMETLKSFFEKYDVNNPKEADRQKNSNHDFNQLITSKLNEIWAEQLLFDETLKNLKQKLGPNSSVSDLLTCLERIGTSLIKMLANLASNIETEKKNLYKMARKIDHKLDKMEGIRMNINDGKSILISQEEIKNDGFSDDFGLQTEKDSKVSLKSGEILFSEPPINFNYNELPLKKLRPIKEEDYSYQNRDEETLQVKKASPDNLEPLAESQKLKDLQSALSRSLNKKKVEDFYTSKIEHTVFQSFEHSQRNEEGDDQNIYNNTLLTEMRKNNINGNSFSSSESSHSQIEEPIGSPFRVLKNCDPVKKRLLSQNEGFKNMLLTNDMIRTSLPKLVDISLEAKIWDNLRRNLEKNINKLVIPVELHEPLSILQRLCEPFEQEHLLDKTEEIEASTLRLAYVMGFAFSSYSSTILRVKKPFESLLGETYEFSPPNMKFRYFSEQVSFNPSIIATFCESESYKAWSNLNFKTTFYGKYMEYRAIGVSHIVLKKNMDHFIWTKPVKNLENIVSGNPFLDIYGDMNFTNLTTHETGVISLNKNDTSNENIKYGASGYIKNGKGKVVYNITGRLDKFFKVVEAETQKQIIIWEYKKELELLSQNQYYFDQMTLQLNHLNQEILVSIASTDSRLRPDIRALEYLDYKVCLKEKNRIEEKEKNFKKLLGNNNEIWKPRWFTSEVDEVTKLKSYVFLENGEISDRENYIDIF